MSAKKQTNSKRLVKSAFFPMPTYRAAIYLACIGGSCAYAILRGSGFFTVITAFLAAMLPLSVIYGFVCFCGLSAEMDISSPYLKKGEEGAVRLTVTNLFPLPLPKLEAKLFMPPQAEGAPAYSRIGKKTYISVTMGGMRALTTEKALCLGYAGSYTAECSKISVYDPLGLFKFISMVNLHYDIPVLPVGDCEIEARKGYSVDGDTVDRTRRGDNRDEVFEISDYTPGDSLKDIHWKRSAKEENLQIIKYAATKENAHCILCDTGDYIFEEKSEDKNARLLSAVLETAYVLCLNGTYSGEKVQVACRKGTETVGATATAEQAFAMVCQSGYVTEVSALRVYGEKVSGATTVNLVTACINQETVKQVVEIQTHSPNVKGITVTLCTCEGDAYAIQKDALKSLETAGIHINYSQVKGGAV